MQVPADASPHPLKYCPGLQDEALQAKQADAPEYRMNQLLHHNLQYSSLNLLMLCSVAVSGGTLPVVSDLRRKN